MYGQNNLHPLLPPRDGQVEHDRSQVEQTYNCKVAAVLPYSDEMMALASADIFVLRYPDHPLTATLKQVAAKLVA